MTRGYTWIWFVGATAMLAPVALGFGGGDFVGAIILLLAFVPALTSKDLHANPRVAAAFIVVMLAHTAVATLDATVAPTLGAEMDAAGYHADARDFAASHAIDPDYARLPPEQPYVALLGYTYRFLGASLLLGNALSVLMIALACVLLVKIARQMDLDGNVGTLLLFGLLPSGVMMGSVTLREAYQQALMLLALNAVLRMRGGRWRWSVVVLAAVVPLSIIHEGLPLYSGYFVTCAFIWAAPPRAGRRQVWRLAGALAAIAVMAVIASTVGSTAVDAVENGTAFEYADHYRHVGENIDARTVYGLRLDTSSALGLAATVPVVFVEYMLAPFPWQVQNLFDVEALAEAILRLTLIIAALVSWRRARGLQRSQLALLLWLYFGMELLWSLGTINWGTSIRHHLPGFALLALAGGPLIVRAVGDLAARSARGFPLPGPRGSKSQVR
jgi:hypothetical protein